MRNKILFILLLAAAFVVGGLTVVAYQDYQTRSAAEYQAKVQEQQRIDQAEKTRAAAEAAEKQRLATECKDGLAAYNKLTVTQQKTTQKPVCDLQQVE